MKKNIGNTDRLIRFAVAAVLAIAYVMGWVSGWMGTAALILAVVLAATGLMRFCALYTLLGINTCATDV